VRLIYLLLGSSTGKVKHQNEKNGGGSVHPDERFAKALRPAIPSSRLCLTH